MFICLHMSEWDDSCPSLPLLCAEELSEEKVMQTPTLQETASMKHVVISEKYYVFDGTRYGNGGGRRGKKLKVRKEKVNRKETVSWQVGEEELKHETQVHCIQLLAERREKLEVSEGWCHEDAQTEYLFRLIRRHLQEKLGSYRLQDRRKQWDDTLVLSLREVTEMLAESALQCYYCSCSLFLWYEKVLEPKQWTLDRCCNNKGHTKDNVVIACLECNLKRRRQNKEAFLFTKTVALNVHKLEERISFPSEDGECVSKPPILFSS